MVVPVGVPALVIGIISLLFCKRHDSGFSGILIILLIDIVLTIFCLVTVSKGFWGVIGFLFVPSISALPGLIMAYPELLMTCSELLMAVFGLLKNAVLKDAARLGLVLQFGMMATFFYMLLGTDVFFALSESKHLPLYLIFSGAISLAFGIVSLLFRRDTLPPFPAGIVFLLLMLAMTSITVSVLGGSGIIASILLVLITAIPASLLFFSGHWKWGIVFVVLMSIVGFIIIGNNSVFLGFSIIGFLTLSISAIPGIIIIKKAENDFSHGTAIASVIIALIIGGLLIWLFPNNKTESVTEAITSAIPNATVTSDTLNIRFLPRMNSKVIKTLKKSDAVYLTGDTIRKGWSEVEYADGTGCVTQDQVAYIFPRLGWWKVTGRQGSIKMTASMNIEEINNNNFSGYFQWREDKKNPGFYGKENFRGVYDPQTRKVSIQGYSLDERIVQ
jgi:hypothetical protein